jgi:hypothetical protein
MAQVLGTKLMDENDEFTASMVCAVVYQPQIGRLDYEYPSRWTFCFPFQRTRYHGGVLRSARSYRKGCLKNGTACQQFTSMKERRGPGLVPRFGWR